MLTIDSLPPTPISCTRCNSHRAHVLGKILTLAEDVATVHALPLNWSGVHQRRRLALDPLRTVPLRTSRDAAAWSKVADLFDPWISSEYERAREAAHQLDPDPLLDALVALAMQAGIITTPPGASPAVIAMIADPCHYQVNTTHIHAEISDKARRHLTPTRRYIRATTSSLVPHLMVSPHRHLLPDSSAVVYKIIDLLMLRQSLSATAAVVHLPLKITPFLDDIHHVAIAPIAERYDDEILHWASRLYTAAPQRTLPAALAAADRLWRARRRPSLPSASPPAGLP